MRSHIVNQLLSLNPNALLCEEYEDALIGIAFREDGTPVAMYDRTRCLLILEAQGLEDAEEWFSFNVDCAWMGPNTPVFATIESWTWSDSLPTGQGDAAEA